MADFKISQLDALSAGDITRDDVIIINEGDATTKKTTLTSFFSSDEVKDLIAGGDGTGGSEIDDLYVKLAGNDSDVQTITGTAGLKTAGLLESAGGVRVSGGAKESVVDGLYYDGRVNFVEKGDICGVIADGTVYVAGPGNPGASTCSKIATTGYLEPKADGTASVVVIDNYTGLTESAVNYTFNSASFDANGGGTVTGEVVGYSTAGNLGNIAPTNIGYKGNLGIVAGKDNFNFYAAGSAPNYFDGDVYFGEDEVVSIDNSSNVTGLSVLGGGLSGRMIQCFTNSNPDSGTYYINRIGSTTGLIFAFSYGDSLGGGISTAGRIRLTSANSVNFEDMCDYRLKTNVTSITNAAEKVKAIKPYAYEFTNEPGVVHQGFFAHELQEQVPMAVSGTKDATEAIGTLTDYDGTVLETEVTEPSAEELTYTEEVETDGVTTTVTRTKTWSATGERDVYQGVDQTRLIPLLTKALQEALERIEALENA